MPAIKIEQFGGMLPAWDPHLLPTGQGAYAKNGYLFSGALTGWRKPKLLRALNSSTARSVYRIPTVSKVQARAYLVFLTAPNAGDQVSIGDLTYTFRTTLPSVVVGSETRTGNPFDVLIGSDSGVTALYLGQAITADSGLNTHAGNHYGEDTPLNQDVKYFLPDTDPVVGQTDPQPGIETIGGTDYHYLVVGAVDFGASYNLLKVSTTAPTRILWVYDLLDLLHVTTSFAGGTNPKFDSDITGAATWLEFDDPDTNVFKSPIVDDQWNRYYTASPSDMPKYNTYDRIQTASPFWLLGVPPPGCAVTLEVTGGGNNLQLGNVTPSGGSIVGLPNRIYTTMVTTPGDTQIQDVSFQCSSVGMPADGFPDAHFASVVYTNDDSSGTDKPGDLINTGRIVTGINADGVMTSAFVNPTSLLGNEKYWIGFMLDTAVPLEGGPAGGSSNTDSWSNTFTNGPPGKAPNSAFARTSLVNDGTNVADGDKLTIGLSTYTYKNTLTPTAGEIHIGANGDATLANTEHCINQSGGTVGTDYVATSANFYCSAGAVLNHAIEITAKSQATPFDIVVTHFDPVGSPPHMTLDAPTLEPGFEVNQPGINLFANFITSDIIEARSYVYTWVSEYGEEGPPSPPTILDGWSNGTWTLGLWQPPPNDLGILRNLKKINIYRTVPGQGGRTVFFFVDTVDIGVASYVDTNKNNDVALNDELASTNWFPPPENLQGFQVMQNGMVAAFQNNEIWFCEPFHPHAWPPGYMLAVDFPIVGMGLTSNALVVMTSANPYVLTGTAPSSMSQAKCSDAHPCSSRSSILNSDAAVSYISPNGLIQVVAAGLATNTTDLWFTRENWAQLTPPHDSRAIHLASCYFCLGAVSRDLLDTSQAQRGFTIELDQDNTSFSIWPQPGGHRLGFEVLDSPTGFDIKNVLTDPWTSIGLVVSNGSVWYYDFSDVAPTMQTYTWRSKLYQQNARRSYSAMKVFFQVPTNTPALNPTRIVKAASDPVWATLPSDRYGFIKTYVDITGDGSMNLIDCREIRSSGELLRIVGGFKADTYQWEITARVPISNVQIGTTVKELAQV